MKKPRILIVDDEENIRDLIKEYLSLENYIVDEASDGTEALELFNVNEYSLIVLDIMMPRLDGWSVCREIRKQSEVPIIMLSARGEEYDKLLGFELGIDDYMVKPFSPKELLARIRVFLKRSQQQIIEDTDRFSVEGLTIDYTSRNVYIDNEKINLTPKEYELLQFFSKHPNKVFSRDQLLNAVWGYEFYGDNRTVDTHVKMLRVSLKDYRKLIVTVWGTGYKFEMDGLE